MIYEKQTHAGSDVAGNNKIRTDLLSFQQPAKSMLGDERNMLHCTLQSKMCAHL